MHIEDERVFGVVLGQRGLRFMPNKPGVLREMGRVLVRGGLYLLGVTGADVVLVRPLVVL